MSLWLTQPELETLTGFKTRRRQKLALGQMGVPFVSRAADGFPLVARIQFETSNTSTSAPRRRTPKLELVS